LATTASDEPSVSAEKVLKRQKKQARREAKLMLAIKAAKKDLKKAQARLEERSTTLHTLEARLEELRAQSPQAATDATSQSATDAEPTSLLGEEATLPEGLVVITDATQVDAMQENEAAIVRAPASTTTRKTSARKSAARHSLRPHSPS
jgi:chromosome segregation ATPase